jgi:nucleoside-diphosphate-sugar epimerase
MVSIFLTQALTSGKVHVKGSAARFRDFIHVDDVAEAWVRAAFDRKPENAVLNLGTGIRSTVSDLLSEMQNHIPGMEWFCDGTTPGDQNGMYAETSALLGRLGLSRMKKLKEGIPEFIDWAKGTISPKWDRKQGSLVGRQ